jgi:YesN/AraC family two-component response regulator
VFLIANFDIDEPLDELFYQIHKYIRETIASDNCLITIGVDNIKNDISTLKDACEGALHALDEMMIDGRGEVYFNDLQPGNNMDYFFPKNFTEKLVKELKKGQVDEIKQQLQDIYQKNWNLGGTSEMYHALVDELHLSVLKAIKEITDLNTIHISIEKFQAAATLEEIFKYYEAALDSILVSIQKAAAEETEADQLEEEILRFINDNYCDPEMSLQYLTDKFDVSSKYLSIFSKNHYGTTYLQYIQNKRIEKALELMKSNQYSLTQICNICGYTNQLTFRRNFKSVTGMNPSDFNHIE